MFNCSICSKPFHSTNSLVNHIGHVHYVKIERYYLQFIDKEAGKCSCGENKKFLGLRLGYMEFCKKCTWKNAKQKMSQTRKKQFDDGVLLVPSGWNRGRAMQFSENAKLNMKRNANRLHSEGFENKGGRCQFYQVDGVIIQGRYELAFYISCVEKPKRAPRIKTPFGWYSPDFEFEDRFVEIKSNYTIKTCIANGQYKKIAWVRKNIKNIEIKVLNEEDTRLFLLQHDISKLRYRTSKN